MITNDNRTTLITGASSGIGAAFAKKLASLGYDLVLVARREAKLIQMATDLQTQFPIHAQVLVGDLSRSAGIEQVEQRIAELPNLQMLVNNAGFGVPGKFAEVSLERTMDMIEVHVLASVQLCHAALPGMIAQNKGGIVNVSSIGAFIPRAGDATYCATKAYLVAFSQALQGELLGTGIRIQALCPGFVPTEFLDHPDYEVLQVKHKIPKWLWTSAEEVVEQSFRSLKRDQVICIPGFKNRILVSMARLGLAGVLTQRLAKSLRESNQLSTKHLSTSMVDQLSTRMRKP